MNRCLNDTFAYCTGTPEHTTAKVSVQYRDYGGRLTTQDQLHTRCKLDLNTCGSYLKHAQLHALKTT